MKKYKFTRDAEGGLIHINACVDDWDDMLMVVDTAATRTSFDMNEYLMAGYSLDKPVGQDLVETVNGIISVDVFEIESLTALGKTWHNVQVQVCDYLKQGILSNYQGILGLDFFEGTRFTVDMVENTIEVMQPNLSLNI